MLLPPLPPPVADMLPNDEFDPAGPTARLFVVAAPPAPTVTVIGDALIE
jgi:hypothetical protein